MGRRLSWVLERLLSFDGLLPGFDDLMIWLFASDF